MFQHAFGWNGLKLSVVPWGPGNRIRSGDFHEVAMLFDGTSVRHNVLAVRDGSVASMVARAAERVYVKYRRGSVCCRPSVRCRMPAVPSKCERKGIRAAAAVSRQTRAEAKC